jgi:hypothetical protein
VPSRSRLLAASGVLSLALALAACTNPLIAPADGGDGPQADAPSSTGAGGGGGAAGAGGSGGGSGGAGGAGGAGGGVDARPDAATDTAVDVNADLASPDLGGSEVSVPPVTPSAAGQIVVTELMHDPDLVSDDFGEWFEIYNPSDTVTYDLQSCEIRDNANVHVIARALVVPPHAFRTLGLFSVADGTMGGGFVPDYTYTSVKFNNDAADSVNIACNGALIDRFAYTAADAATSGHSFSVDPSHYDAATNDQPGSYCLSQVPYRQAMNGDAIIRDYGTPGATNPPCP